MQQVLAQSAAPEGSSSYDAPVTNVGGAERDIRAVRLVTADDRSSPSPKITRIERLDHFAAASSVGPDGAGGQ